MPTASVVSISAASIALPESVRRRTSRVFFQFRKSSQDCDGGMNYLTGGCPLFSDEPLLGFLKNQSIGDCWTIPVGGEHTRWQLSNRYGSKLAPLSLSDWMYPAFRAG